MVLTVAFSGFACNGKTTLIKTIAGVLKCSLRNTEVITMDETARKVYQYSQSYFNTKDESAFQLSILSAELERIFLTTKFLLNDGILWLPKFEEKDVIILFDRSIFDNIAFSVAKNIISLQTAEEILSLIQKEIDFRYQLLFLCPPVYSADFINKCLSDNVRNQTLPSTVDAFLKLQTAYYETLNHLMEKAENMLSYSVIKLKPIDTDSGMSENIAICLDKIGDKIRLYGIDKDGED